MTSPVKCLPSKLLDCALVRGCEFAWRIEDIPAVIRAAQDAELVNLGGRLKFFLPDDDTCDCYWVEVDTYPHVPKSLPWDERVAKSADVALTEFAALRESCDFLAQGMGVFGNHLQTVADPAQAMCFVWDMMDAQTSATRGW